MLINVKGLDSEKVNLRVSLQNNIANWIRKMWLKMITLF